MHGLTPPEEPPMKKLTSFVTSTIAGGFFVLLPVVLVALVIIEVVGVLAGLAVPIAELLPVDELGGIGMATIVAIAMLLLILFVTGLILKSQTVRRLWHGLEKRLLQPLPGYPLIKSLTQRFAGSTEGSRFAPAIVNLSDGLETPGFIVETHDSGKVTVLVPFAPTPTLGTIYHVDPARVRPAGTSMGEAVNCVMQWGIDSKRLFEGEPPGK
jgi:uncharacterized membrane protein